jgi:hypothetical protein
VVVTAAVVAVVDVVNVEAGIVVEAVDVVEVAFDVVVDDVVDLVQDAKTSDITIRQVSSIQIVPRFMYTS